ncbi:MAG: rhamnulokinase [Propionibacteriaceae bacterium]|jgi:rhamnulokinase|nr:rhamnulokinase [Propionibacteriaceae bacterium]
MDDTFAAVDLGASSGRVIVGRLSQGRVELSEALRFPNGPAERGDGIHWDAEGMFGHIRAGVQRAIDATGGRLASVGVDTWGVDYGRLDAAGKLLEEPFHYRDLRTAKTVGEVFAKLPPQRLYAACGLQVMPFNTIFQYVAQAGDPAWRRVDKVLLMPDLFSYWLCGKQVAEVTIASTTGLLDVAARQWSADTLRHLADAYGLPFPAVLPPLVEPGTVLGPTLPGLFSQPVQVVAVGGHDTASAVVSVPSTSRDFAFISSGTWSLVGMELEAPVLSEASRQADFTNELGADGTTRYLKNVMGLWVLNECMRNWREQGREQDLAGLLDAAARLPALGVVVDIDDERLMPPQDMPATLRALAAETGQELSDDPAAMARCVIDSLALAYRSVINQAAAMAGRTADVVHIVGGGSRNALLCQLTAEATGLPVVAGPVEGTALGNILVQARAMGALSGGLDRLREVAIASSELKRYSPGVLDLPPAAWEDAARKTKGK